jgi:hypothetical protein
MSAFNCQTLINSGLAWKLEGHVGRTCMAAIENGDSMLGLKGYRDYYGNYVPSRFEVQEGTKGSRSFVVEHNGEEWALSLEEVSDDTQEALEDLSAITEGF